MRERKQPSEKEITYTVKSVFPLRLPIDGAPHLKKLPLEISPRRNTIGENLSREEMLRLLEQKLSTAEDHLGEHGGRHQYIIEMEGVDK